MKKCSESINPAKIARYRNFFSLPSKLFRGLPLHPTRMSDAIDSLQKLIANGEASPILIRFAAWDANTRPAVSINNIFVDIFDSLIVLSKVYLDLYNKTEINDAI